MTGAQSPPHGHMVIRSLFLSGLESVDPVRGVREVLRVDGDSLHVAGVSREIPDRGIQIVAFGKAAVPMASAACDVLGERVDQAIALTKAGADTGRASSGIRVFEASHPVPDERGFVATREILDTVSHLGPDDIVLALISGGGSALLEAPRPPLTLQDMQVTTDLLLRAGAPITDLNGVRSELSLVKGGGLRQAIGAAACIDLILSDVLGNDRSVIASGPTVARQRDPQRALAIIDRYGLRDRVPSAVLAELEKAGTTSALAATSRHRDAWVVIGDNTTLLDAIEDSAERLGLRVSRVTEPIEGEAGDAAARFVAFCDDQANEVDFVLGGGECTVTVRGDGRGGRNTEFALSAALALHERRIPWTVASLASDGDDGNADAAGAIADHRTVTRGVAQRPDAPGSLRANDSATFFAALGDLVVTGQTGTNVNDVYLAVRHDALERAKDRVDSRTERTRMSAT